MVEQRENNGNNKINTTIAIWKSTKDKLDKNKAPGQCYNGFICQLLEKWEQIEKLRDYCQSGTTSRDQDSSGFITT